jgi:monoterpene epsilon-lactone hydrolase
MTLLQRRTLNTQLHASPPSPPPGLEGRRQWFVDFMSTMRVPEGLSTDAAQLGGVPALRVAPSDRQRPGTILYFHGGANVIGSPWTAMSLTGALVERTRIGAVSVDYRLAPEHPFPAGIQDGVAAYRALLEQGEPSSSIVFAGDSAGGGLSVTTTLVARQEGLPLPAGIVAFSGGFDATRTGESMVTKAEADPFFTRETFSHTGAMYLNGADPHQDVLSPATLADLTGFPPMLLQVGTNEMLLDDTVRLAERARAHDVDVILDVTADVPHVFQSYSGVLDEADQALARAALFISQRLS